jgi:CheY-like chemotaxis protein
MAVVLIAVPSVDLALDLLALLEDAGHRVIDAGPSPDATLLAYADAIIMDLETRDLDAGVVRESVKRSHAPLVLLSAAGHDERLALRWGAIYVQRPPLAMNEPHKRRHGAAGGATQPDVLWGKVLIDALDAALSGVRGRLDSIDESAPVSEPSHQGPRVCTLGTGPLASLGDILIVDDDDHIRETLSGVLTQEGYAVSSAGNGLEALSLMRRSSTPPRVILTDLMMPEMNGWELCRHLREDPALSRIPVAVISAVVPYQEPEERESGDKTRLRLVKKPVNLEELLDEIADALR